MKRAKTINTIILVLAGLLSSATATAQSFTYEGIRYVVKDAMEKTVYTANGSRPDPSVELTGDVIFPEKVWYEGEAYTLVGIGTDSYSLCDGLTSVELPNTVIEIGPRAFNNCTSLRSVKLGDSVETIGAEAFMRCSSLSNVNLGSSVVTIGTKAFIYCDDLEEIILPKTVVTVGYNAFPTPTVSSKNVRKAAYPASISNPFGYGVLAIAYPLDAVIEDGEIYSATKDRIYFTSLYNEGYYEIPNTVKRIQESAFVYCSGITGISLPGSVETIGTDAFKDCTALQRLDIDDIESFMKIDFASVNSNPLYFTTTLYLDGEEVKDLKIPESITELKKYALYGFKGMKSIEIPSSVSAIYDYALARCTVLTTLDIPNSVTTLGEGIIYGSNSLKTIGIPDNLTIIPESCFKNCEGKLELDIPDSVEDIEDFAFEDCYQIQSIAFGESVRKIGENAFRNAKALKELTLPETLEEIGPNAFYRLDSIEELVIPNSVKTIDNSAFYENLELKRVVIGNSVVNMLPNTFANCKKLTSVTIGKGMRSMDYAFGNDKNIMEVTVLAKTPPTAYVSKIFDTDVLSQATLYVPEESYELYATHPYWGQFLNIVPSELSGVEGVEIDENGTFSVYNLQGVCLYQSADREQVDSLPAGFYIVNGKKRIIR